MSTISTMATTTGTMKTHRGGPVPSFPGFPGNEGTGPVLAVYSSVGDISPRDGIGCWVVFSVPMGGKNCLRSVCMSTVSFSMNDVDSVTNCKEVGVGTSLAHLVEWTFST